MAVGSASKVGRIKRCKKAFYYSDIKKLQRKKKSIAPTRGILIHNSLQAHYSGKDWVKPIQDFIDNSLDMENVFDEERAEWGNLAQEAYRIMRGYLVAYRERDAQLKTLATEVEFSFDLDKHTYMGYIDWIYEDENGLVWVCDHKTVKNLPSEADLYMDMQTILYYEACRKDENLIKLLKGKKLGGVVFNHIRTKAPREPQVLKSGGLSKASIDTDVATYFSAVKKAGLDINDYRDMVDKLKSNVFFKRTRLPVSERMLEKIKEDVIASLRDIDAAMDIGDCPKDFPRTLIKNRCSWDCEFSRLCFAELSGAHPDTIANIIEEDYQERERREEETNDE